MLTFDPVVFLQEIRAAPTSARRLQVLSPRIITELHQATWTDVKDTGIIEVLLDIGTEKKFETLDFYEVSTLCAFLHVTGSLFITGIEIYRCNSLLAS